MSDAAPKRRWFRFSLQTFCIVVAVIGMFLGWFSWNIRFVQRRHAMRQEILAENERRDQALMGLGGGIALSIEILNVQPAPRASRDPSLIRQWLGDRAMHYILRTNRAAALRAVELFPEARIAYFTGSYDPRITKAVIESADSTNQPTVH